MRLLLSSDALPHASVEALREAATRRALAGLELALDAGQGHGADATPRAARHGLDLGCFAEAPADAAIAWLLLPDDAAFALRGIWAAMAGRIGAGVLVRQPTPERLGAVPTALVHGTDLEAAQLAARWAEAHGAQTAWQIRPADFDADRWAAVLDATGPRLAHVRLLGAGPEAEAGDGAEGTGWLFGQLALRGYAGTIALAPSSPDALPAWERWLRRGRGWGCATAAEKAAARRSLATSTP